MQLKRKEKGSELPIGRQTWLSLVSEGENKLRRVRDNTADQGEVALTGGD